ncbi:MAG: putative zinc-binding metallopeptidase, partial [Gammaproteobacteria bacterium]|nr:putative zinc-binding metallopeptidase [Gammaproteobacteria bacterium]
LTLLLNSLTRSLGQPDAYPFALAGEALEKLRFVHDMVREEANRPTVPSVPAPATASATIATVSAPSPGSAPVAAVNVVPAAPTPAPKQNIKKNSKQANKDLR